MFERTRCNLSTSYKSVLVGSLLLTIAACDRDLPTDSQLDPMANVQPVASAASASANAADDRYIVLFKNDVSDVPGLARQLTHSSGGTMHFVFTSVVRGFAATLPAQAIAGLQNNPHVALIEPDLTVTTNDVQSGPVWGLDRIDQRSLPLSSSYNFSSTGSGVTAYIIDTGIRYTHAQFAGRASFGFDALGGDGSDCNGHGTHVAGTVGGSTYGVAKSVGLVAVRVLNCQGSGYLSAVIAGMDWVATHHSGPSVVNMSLGAGLNLSLNQAVANLAASGVVVVVAAGNSGANACNYSPASAPEAVTVGATDNTDTRASFSNFGSCVDLFAPGVGVVSSYHNTDLATSSLSGTSMASPHVAGVAALFLERNPGASVTAINDSLNTWSTKAVVKNSNSVNNHLVFSPSSGSVTPPPPPPPGPAPISLTASARKVKGSKFVDLSWSGANSTLVDVFRNGSRVAATSNTGVYVDALQTKGGGSYTYRVCDGGTTRCSSNQTVSF